MEWSERKYTAIIIQTQNRKYLFKLFIGDERRPSLDRRRLLLNGYWDRWWKYIKQQNRHDAHRSSANQNQIQNYFYYSRIKSKSFVLCPLQYTKAHIQRSPQDSDGIKLTASIMSFFSVYTYFYRRWHWLRRPIPLDIRCQIVWCGQSTADTRNQRKMVTRNRSVRKGEFISKINGSKEEENGWQPRAEIRETIFLSHKLNVVADFFFGYPRNWILICHRISCSNVICFRWTNEILTCETDSYVNVHAEAGTSN